MCISVGGLPDIVGLSDAVEADVCTGNAKDMLGAKELCWVLWLMVAWVC